MIPSPQFVGFPHLDARRSSDSRAHQKVIDLFRAWIHCREIAHKNGVDETPNTPYHYLMHPSADQVVETFGAAADENRMEPLRQEQVIHLPGEGELWMTGDLHDHRRNFDKLMRAVELGANPQRHLILHELIHGDHYDASGAEESWITLYRAAELKCDFPEQVHFLLANHDLAQIHGKGIMKAGLSVCEAFSKGVKKCFDSQHAIVTAAISDFLLSVPLAVRAPNGIFCCHSLPQDDQID